MISIRESRAPVAPGNSARLGTNSRLVVVVDRHRFTLSCTEVRQVVNNEWRRTKGEGGVDATRVVRYTVSRCTTDNYGSVSMGRLYHAKGVSGKDFAAAVRREGVFSATRSGAPWTAFTRA